jgi:hypothetical protein
MSDVADQRSAAPVSATPQAQTRTDLPPVLARYPPVRGRMLLGLLLVPVSPALTTLGILSVERELTGSIALAAPEHSERNRRSVPPFTAGVSHATVLNARSRSDDPLMSARPTSDVGNDCAADHIAVADTLDVSRPGSFASGRLS